MRFRFIFFIFLIQLTVSVLNAQNTDSIASLELVPIDSSAVTKSFTDSLLRIAEGFKGTPYRLGGHSSRGFDCSGFVNYLYSRFDVPLASSCPGIAMKCDKISKDEVQKGDLIFFKGRNSRSRALGHVSIVYDVDSTGGIRMIHATQRGVVLDQLNKSSYYKPRLLFYARVRYRE